MKSLLFILIGTVIVVAVVLATFLIIDIYQRLDERGYIDRWIDRKFGKGVYIKSKWILCSEELPPIRNPVLLWTIQKSGGDTDKKGRWRIGARDEKGWIVNQLTEEKIVAWHLLPEPFEKRGEIVIE